MITELRKVKRKYKNDKLKGERRIEITITISNDFKSIIAVIIIEIARYLGNNFRKFPSA